MTAISELADRVKADLLALAGEYEADVREAFVSLATDASNVVASVAPTDPAQAARDLERLKNEAINFGLLSASKAHRELTARMLEYAALGLKLLVAV